MSEALAEYLRLTERLIAMIEAGDMAEEDKIRDAMDPIWWRLSDEEQRAAGEHNKRILDHE